MEEEGGVGWSLYFATPPLLTAVKAEQKKKKKIMHFLTNFFKQIWSFEEIVFGLEDKSRENKIKPQKAFKA